MYEVWIDGNGIKLIYFQFFKSIVVDGIAVACKQPPVTGIDAIAVCVFFLNVLQSPFQDLP